MKRPAPGEPSHAQFAAELAAVRRVLAERTATAYHTFNSIPGYFCNPIDVRTLFTIIIKSLSCSRTPSSYSYSPMS